MRWETEEYKPLSWMNRNDAMQMDWAYSYLRKKDSRIIHIECEFSEKTTRVIAIGKGLDGYDQKLKKLYTKLNANGARVHDKNAIEMFIIKMQAAWRQFKRQSKLKKLKVGRPQTFRFSRVTRDNLKALKKLCLDRNAKELTLEMIIEMAIEEKLHNVRASMEQPALTSPQIQPAVASYPAKPAGPTR